MKSFFENRQRPSVVYQSLYREAQWVAAGVFGNWGHSGEVLRPEMGIANGEGTQELPYIFTPETTLADSLRTVAVASYLQQEPQFIQIGDSLFQTVVMGRRSGYIIEITDIPSPSGVRAPEALLEQVRTLTTKMNHNGVPAFPKRQ